MSRRNGILLSLLVVIAAGYGFYTYALSPRQEKAAQLHESVATQQQRLSAAQALIGTNETAKARYRQAYAAVVRLGKAVPTDDDVRSLIVQLDAAAKRSGVAFQSVDLSSSSSAPAAAPVAGAPATGQLPPGATVGAAGFPVMPFQFTFKGKFFHLGSFFTRLERFVRASDRRLSVSGRLLTIDGLKLEPDADGFPNVVATVDATAYVVPTTEGATGGATTAGPTGVPGTAPAPAAAQAASTTPGVAG